MKLGHDFGSTPMGHQQVAAVNERRRMEDLEAKPLMDDEPTRRALRALQIADQAIPIDVYARSTYNHRRSLLRLQSEIGAVLGLVCTGSRSGGGDFDHSGDTCPIHEWLEPSDALDDDLPE